MGINKKIDDTKKIQKSVKSQNGDILLYFIEDKVFGSSEYLTLCKLEIPKQVFQQTVDQMKCHTMRHFIRVCTVC